MLRRVFEWLFLRHDWRVVNALHGKWEVVDRFDDLVTKWCYYELEYSDVRDRYRVVCRGYKPKEHQMYGFAVKEFEKRIKQMKRNG